MMIWKEIDVPPLCPSFSREFKVGITVARAHSNQWSRRGCIKTTIYLS